MGGLFDMMAATYGRVIWVCHGRLHHPLIDDLLSMNFLRQDKFVGCYNSPSQVETAPGWVKQKP
jgi:hypothetical protein